MSATVPQAVQSSYELLLWLIPQLDKFPRVRRFTLTRIFHEHFCCNRRSAATTGLRLAGSPLGPSPYCTSTHRVLSKHGLRQGISRSLCSQAGLVNLSVAQSG